MSIRNAIVALALVAGAATFATTASAQSRFHSQIPTGYMAEVETRESSRSGPSCVWHNMARPSTDDAKNASRC